MSDAGVTDFAVRLARLEELPRLTEIEIDAFATLARAHGDDREPHALPESELKQSLQADLLLVAVDGIDRPIGFLAGIEMDNALYVKELDVITDWQRKGAGRRLMIKAIETASARRLWGVTLTTDRYIPFNAPFYMSLGFREIESCDTVPDLREVLGREVSYEVGESRRMAMVRIVA